MINSIKWLAFALILAILVGNIYTVIARKTTGKKFPTFLGFASAVVDSDSMEPTLSRGDVILVLHKKSYQERDIILFIDKHGDPVTHRIVDVREDGKYTTQGDSVYNDVDGDPVEKGKVVGKVWLTLPKFGKLLAFLQKPVGLVMLTIVGGAVIFMPDILGFFTGKKEDEDENLEE